MTKTKTKTDVEQTTDVEYTTEINDPRKFRHPKHPNFSLQDALEIARSAQNGGLRSDLDDIPSLRSALRTLQEGIQQHNQWYTGKIARQVLEAAIYGTSMDIQP